MASRIIKAVDRKSFLQLIEGKISIPPYQRFYEWEDDLVVGLIEDVFRKITTGETLYLGAVHSKDIGKEHIIIDGQQRVLTLVIILRALCEYLGNFVKHKKLSKKIDKQLAGARFDFKGAFVVDLNEEQQGKYFKDNILKDELVVDPLTKTAGKHFKHVRDLVAKTLPEGFKTWKVAPEKFYSFVCQRLEFVTIVLSKAANESEIFEAINSKRKELASIDNLKNLIYHVTEHGRWDDVGKQWDFLGSGFGGTRDLEVFIGHFATACAFADREYSTKQPRVLLKAFRKELGMRSNTVFVKWGTIKRLFAKLNRYKKSYLVLTDPENDNLAGDSKFARIMREKVSFLSKYKYTSHLPLLLAAIEKTGVVKNEKVIALLSQSEIIHFTDRTQGVLPQKTKDKFHALLRKIKTASITSVLKRAKKLANQKNTVQLIANISDGTTKSAEQKIVYVLHRILASNSPDLVKKTFRDLEHVFPQGSARSQYWKTVLKKDIKEISWKRFDLEDTSFQSRRNAYSTFYIHSLGNCCLWIKDENRSAQDAPYNKKLQSYKKEDGNSTMGWITSRRALSWSYKAMQENAKWLADKYYATVIRNIS